MCPSFLSDLGDPAVWQFMLAPLVIWGCWPSPAAPAIWGLECRRQLAGEAMDAMVLVVWVPSVSVADP